MRRNMTIRKTILILFVTSMLLSMTSVCFLIFTRWTDSAERTTERIAEDINRNLIARINALLWEPDHINEMNHHILERGILNLADEVKRDQFFAGALAAHPDHIYSFSFGSVNGEYYGARRNEQGVLEVMRNDASTGGQSWYYSVREDGTSGDLALKAGVFDPRTRPWYQNALDRQGPVFSPIYKHFVMNDLTISAARPIYHSDGKLQGVLGTHMLLSDIDKFLKEAVDPYQGLAVLLEQKTGKLIANSSGFANFNVLADGSLQRLGLDASGQTTLMEAYSRYTTENAQDFQLKQSDHNLYFNIREIHLSGLDWVVMTAVPESLLFAPIRRSMVWTAIISAFIVLISLSVHVFLTKRILQPMHSLLTTASALSSGDLSQRAPIVKQDEIGLIASGVNQVADKLQDMIQHLERSVQDRTHELQLVNLNLTDHKDRLQLILDSTAEAIYGIDLQGICMFCNTSCVKLLGYEDQNDLLGQDMHALIHHSLPDGTAIPVEVCRIRSSINNGKGISSDDEYFWRADGSRLSVEYHAYPQIRNGQVVGAVVTFMDISDRKQKEQEIRYLSCHDTLTGLHNRRCFEENMSKLDKPDYLPLSVIFADINGLKMTNDIFGHAAGDELIKKTASILTQSCRESDLIARMGGDEFTILMPRTGEDQVGKVMDRIRNLFEDARVEAIKCSISMGAATRHSPDETLDVIMANAENAMYTDKTMNRKTVNRDIIDTIVDTLHAKCVREKEHSLTVQQLCVEFGNALSLSEAEIDKLQRAGYLHDIGKIVIDEDILTKESLDGEESEQMRQHPIIGYRILNLFDDTIDLAEYIYAHHERWDGTGYPRGLKGVQIPLISRMLSILETYERVLNRGDQPLDARRDEAVRAVKEGAGNQFDPQIADIFVNMMGFKDDRKEKVK